MKEKQKKFLPIIVLLIVVVMLTVSIRAFINNKSKNIVNTDAELARSMTYAEVIEGEEKTESEFVEFDTFFLRDLDGDGVAEKIRGTCREIGQQDTLYMELKVLTNGYFKDGKITINGNNFYLNTAIVKDSEIASNYISSNTREIELNEINNGTQKLLTGIVRSGDYTYSSSKSKAIGNDITKYSKENSIILSGTHVDEEGNETKITKEVKLNVDWYGKVDCIITQDTMSQTKDIEEIVDEESGTVNLSFNITTQDTLEELIYKKTYIEGTVPELKGYKPLNVNLTGANVNYTYDEETRMFTAEKESTLDASGTVTQRVGKSNTYTLNITYPIEVYQEMEMETIEVKVPVKAYYEGYNNSNIEFENPYKSNTAEEVIVVTYKKTEGIVARFDITTGNHVSSPVSRYVISKNKPLLIYNGSSEEEKEDYYVVAWYASLGADGSTEGITMSETQDGKTQNVDQFIKADGTQESMENVVTNVGIYFSGATGVLKDDGWIKVYNVETNELIKTFTKEEFSKYSSSNPYMYEDSIKHIKIETSSTNANTVLTVYNIKEIDDEYVTSNYMEEQFDNLKYIKSDLSGYVTLNGVKTYMNSDMHSANYEAPVSVAKITTSPTGITTQETSENHKITIQTEYKENSNEVKWLNGAFLLKLPKEVIDLSINNVTIDNNKVSIDSYEVYEENNNYYIKILTSNEEETSYKIEIDCNLTPDPREPTVSRNIELYASNEKMTNYYYEKEDTYDVDDDLNVTEKVNYQTAGISLISPNSLLTNQTATNYDDNKNVTIAPKIAEVEKEQRTANINVNISNNYSNTISEIKVLGKIPFEGNSYVLNQNDLGSTFSTTMTDTAIQIPEELKEYTTVYYSENENPTKDIENETNGWKLAEDITDWSKIKTYLINLESYVMPKGASYTFVYEVNIPNNTGYNEITYSSYAVYFSLDTDEGKYRTSVEPSKLGIKIAQKFNLQLRKTKQDTNIAVEGAIFAITEENGTETKTAVTASNGTLEINNLYVDKIYTLKEVRTPGAYEKNSKEIKFKVEEQDNELVLNIISGEENLKAFSVTQVTEDIEKGIVNFEVENTPKYKLVVTKKDKTTGEKISKVKYKLEGNGLGDGIIVTTNKEGVITLTGLSHDTKYTLTEISADGYYVQETPIIFKVVNNNENLEFVVVSGSFESNSQISIGTATTGVDAQDTVTAELTNEKIPTYTVSLKKYAKGEDTLLKGAQYKIEGEGIKEGGEIYKTDENGILYIPRLYEYVEGKNITGIYTITEITPPEGYALNTTLLQFRAQRNESGNLEIEVINAGALRLIDEKPDITITNAENENSNIEFGVEDEPLFKITKIDEETRIPLPNTKFVIKEVDEELNEIGYAKDINENVVGELIEGIPVIETDEDGVISCGLKTGLYKAVEIESLEGYEFQEDENKRTYYFGIGESKEQETTFGVSWADTISGDLWDKVESVAKTEDRGVIATGYITNLEETDFAGMIAKYSEDGTREWLKELASTGQTKLKDAVQTSDGGYIAVGNFEGKTLKYGEVDTGLTNETTNTKGFVIKVGSSGEYLWSKEIAIENKNVTADKVIISDSGNIIVGTNDTNNASIIEYTANGDLTKSTQITDSIDITDIIVNKSGEVLIVTATKYSSTAGGIYKYSGSDITQILTLDFNATSITRLASGKYIVTGNYTGTSQNIASEGNYDGIIIEYDDATQSISNAIALQGTGDEVISEVAATEDGGFIIGGYTYSSKLDLNGDDTDDITSISGITDGFIVKYDSEGNMSWYKKISGSNMDEVTSIIERDNGEYVAGGYFKSSTVSADQDSSNADLALSKYTDGFLVNYGEIITSPEVAETSEIIVENELKKYNITTDIIETNGVKGGSISGEDLQPYETVKYGQNSINEIKLVPDENFKIAKVTINGEIIKIVPNEDGSVILSQFENVQEDKHIEVQYSDDVSDIKVHHYEVIENEDGSFTYTENKIADDEYYTGTIGEKYTTSPCMDLDKYELQKDSNNEYVTPNNASGVYTAQTQEIIYYYVKKQIPLTVHHYIEGTEEKVPLKDGTVAEDVELKGNEGETYVTSAIFDTELDDKYELVETPKNAEGTYEGDEIIVNYYYKLVARKLSIVKYQEDGITPLEGAKFTIETKKEIEENANTEEKLEETQTIYTTDAKGKVIVTLQSGTYEVTEIEAPEGYQLSENATTEVIINRETTTEEIRITNQKEQGEVIIHHYIEGTTTEVPSTEIGKNVESITKIGALGEIYVSKEAENVSSKYELVETPENASGIISKGTTEVIYYYRLKDTSVLVHHYKEGTTESLSKDVIIEGKADDEYTTNVATDIPANYELVEVPSNATGIMTEETTVVTYYYKLKTSIIETPEITKTSTIAKVTDKNQKVPYIINYKANIDTYIGKAKVTITDQVEYEIDLENSELAGGTYDKANKTISWTEEIAEFNTFVEGKKEIDITKKIELAYLNIDISKKELTNTVTGKIDLETPELSNTVTATKEIPTDYLIDITVNKVWEDRDNIFERRPTMLGLEIKEQGSEEVIASTTIMVKSQDSYTFTNLDKYDENGQEILYTADEREINNEDLFNYTKQVGKTQEIEGTDNKEISITNTMTKIPAEVEVKYVDKETRKEISDRITKSGIVGESFDVTEDVKDINGYTLIEEPEEKTGIYTEDLQTKIYYYAKNTKVIVKYLEKGTNEVLLDQEERNGYEGLAYSTEQKTISGYTFVESTDNTIGTMSREEIVVIYYYAKNTKVTVKHIDKVTEKEIADKYVINGYEGKTYKTEQVVVNGYTLVETSNNTEGLMTEDEIEVTYYYAKNTKVIVNYLEKDTKKVLAIQKVIEGYEGKEYKESPKEISEYTCVESTNNTEGTMTKEAIVINYYYAKNTTLIVEHIDIETEEVMQKDEYKGIVGQLVETKAKDFEKYVLVRSPENTDVTMKEEEIIVRYYYKRVSSGVIEKHVDDITGELLYNEEHNGDIGDEYSISSKTFQDYDLVTEDKDGNNRLPENREGKFTKDVIEVKYYYKKRTKVIVRYVDKLTDEEIENETIIEGHEKDSYKTESKEIKGYILVEDSGNTEGDMESTEKTVTYYYMKKSAEVIERHIDVNSKKILVEEKHTGKVTDQYQISPREFEGYELAEDMLPTNAKGEMQEEVIEVDYYYYKKSKVIVEYIDKLTGEIINTEKLTGREGDSYETEDKTFDGYDLEEIPTNKIGTFKDNDITVKYYYIKKAKVEIQYLEKETGNPLVDKEIIEGHIGDKYETEQKDIPYYDFIEATDNTKGNMSSEKITVTYYYKKQVFNLKVDKWIESVSVNGIPQGGKSYADREEMYKLEINRNKVSTANVKVTYKIRITNIGDIDGYVDRLVEVIPSGFEFDQKDNSINWIENNKILTTMDLKSEPIARDSYKEIEVVLRWKASEENLGEKNNIVLLSQISNLARYRDIDDDDNMAKSNMLITVSTGLDRNDRILLIGGVQIFLAIGIGIAFSYKKKK